MSSKDPHIDFYGVRLQADAPASMARGTPKAMVHFMSQYCSGVDPWTGESCEAVHMIPLGIAPVALLCPNCFTVALYEWGRDHLRFANLVDTSARFRIGSADIAVHYFFVQGIFENSVDAFSAAKAAALALHWIVTSETNGHRALVAGSTQVAGQQMLLAQSKLDLSVTMTGAEYVEAALLPTVDRLASAGRWGFARGCAQRAFSLRPDLEASQTALMKAFGA